MKKTIILCATLLVGASSVGCSKEVASSANIKTAGIAALIDVTSEDAKLSTVHVELRVSGSSSNTFVILESGDKLTAAIGEEDVTTTPGTTTIKAKEGTSKAMQSQSEGEYEAEFSETAEDTIFMVNFERATDDDALANNGKMPAPFEITSLPTTSPSRAMEDITVTWNSMDTDADMKMELNGTCIFSESIDVPGDEGKYIIPAGTLESTGGDMPSTCDITVTLTRTQEGTADPIFHKESWFKLHQVRAAKFTSKP